MLRRIWHIIIKEFIQALRDPRLRLFVILPPLLQLIIYGYAINFDIKHIVTAVFDEDRTPESRELINRFAVTDYFDLRYRVTHQEQLKELMDRGQITLAVRISPDFTKNLRANRPALVQLIIDGTDSNAALVVSRYASTILTDHSQELLEQRLRERGLAKTLTIPVTIEPRAWFNVNLVSRYTYVPGVIAMVVMLVSLMLTALSVVREKEIGTMEQILVTPIRPLEFMLGKTIPFVLISLGDVVLVTLVGIFWFEVPFRGNPLALLLGVIFFLFNSVGLGLLISTVSTTQQQAMMAGSFFFTPAILLSGLVFPIPNMPLAVQYLTFLNPLSYFIIIIQDVFLKGVGLAVLWPQLVGLALLGAGLLTLSVLRFRERLA
jgi:ABC-2 type transport system permease protein